MSTQHDEGRTNTQVKSFTKWVNKQLEKKQFPLIKSVIEDFSDGKSLLNLLNVIYGEEIPSNVGNLSNFQKRDNIDRAIRFIESNRIDLINVDADLIYNKNVKLTLGMTWALILRSISKYTNDQSDANNFKKVLLKWCQDCVKNYKNVHVRDFTTSWKNGLAFNALLHRFAPSLVDYDSLNPKNDKENLQNAFELAEKHFNIAKFLDPEDLTENVIPDEKSIITYLSQYYLKLEGLDFKSHLEKGQEYIKSMSHFLNHSVINYNKLVQEILSLNQSKKESIQNLIETLQKLISFDEKTQIIKKMINVSTLYGDITSSFPIFKKKEFEISEEYQPVMIINDFKNISTFSNELINSIDKFNQIKSHNFTPLEAHCKILSRKIETNNEKEKRQIQIDRKNAEVMNIKNLDFKKVNAESGDKNILNESILNEAYEEKYKFIDHLSKYKQYISYRSDTAIKLFKTYDPKNTKIINENNFKNCCIVLNIPIEKEINEDQISFEEYLEYVYGEFDKQEKECFIVTE